MSALEDDLRAAADEELERACAMKWRQLFEVMPWGDTFEGFTPLGRAVCFERSYLWDDMPGGDIRVEVSVFEPKAFEQGVRLTGGISRDEDPV